MTPGHYDLIIYRGDTYRYRFTLWADTARTDPADLTGATAKAEIRTAPGGTVLGEIECTITLPNIIDGVLDSVASKTLRNGSWDLQLSYTGTPPDVKTVLAGSVTMTPDVTDSGATVYGR